MTAFEEISAVAAQPARKLRKAARQAPSVIEFHTIDIDQGVFHVVVGDAGAEVVAGPAPRADARVHADDAALSAVFRGDVSISQPIARRTITFDGRYLSLIRLEKLIISSKRRKP